MVGLRFLAPLIFAAAVTACSSVRDGGRPASCVEDEAALLSLDYEAFDQDLTPGGWRAIAGTAGCAHAAAALIAAWRERHAGGLRPDQMQILWWHEGQVLASAGDYNAAVLRLEASRTFHYDRAPPPKATADEVETWKANIAVRDAWQDATIAFLRRDRSSLEKAHARMLSVAEPADYSQLQDLIQQKTGTRMVWPLNIEDVERMLACFDYRYGVECRDEEALKVE